MVSAIFLCPFGTTTNTNFLFIAFKSTKAILLLDLNYIGALILSIKPIFAVLLIIMMSYFGFTYCQEVKKLAGTDISNITKIGWVEKESVK
jgi:hypothetical protein